MAKLEYLEQTKKDKELHDLVAADKAATKYKKHYEFCYEIVGQICDFSSKVAEYRELTDDLIPPKLWRDWVNLFKSGKPLYPEVKTNEIKDIDKLFNADMAAMGEDTAKLLDECDFNEYKVLKKSSRLKLLREQMSQISIFSCFKGNDGRLGNTRKSDRRNGTHRKQNRGPHNKQTARDLLSCAAGRASTHIPRVSCQGLSARQTICGQIGRA